MKYLILLLLFGANSAIAEVKTNNPQYDAQLAEKLGADDYGMKSYILVMLKSGSIFQTMTLYLITSLQIWYSYCKYQFLSH